jgi:hypothetical protein
MCLNKTYTNVRRGRDLIHFLLRRAETRRCFIDIAFKLCFGIFQQKVQENQEGLTFNWTYQFLVSVESGNLLGEKLHAMKKTHKLY